MNGDFDPGKGKEPGRYRGVDYRVVQKGKQSWEVYIDKELIVFAFSKSRALVLIKRYVDREKDSD